MKGRPGLLAAVLNRAEIIGSVLAGLGLIAVLGLGPFEPPPATAHQPLPGTSAATTGEIAETFFEAGGEEGSGGRLSSLRGAGWPMIALGVGLLVLSASRSTGRAGQARGGRG